MSAISGWIIEIGRTEGAPVSPSVNWELVAVASSEAIRDQIIASWKPQANREHAHLRITAFTFDEAKDPWEGAQR
jgi:hypothetical protein